MTTRFECPRHGAMKPGQILHNGHTYTCSTCGQGLRANSEDTRDAEIVRLRAEVKRHRAVQANYGGRYWEDRCKDAETREQALAALCAEAADVLDRTANDTLLGRNMADKLRRQAEATP